MDGNMYKVGDFVTYFEANGVEESCVIISIENNFQYRLQTLEIHDNLSDEYRYTDIGFYASEENFKLITNKKQISKLQKLMIFQ